MGTKNNPAPNDCYTRALPDEPMFTLLARDPGAPDLIRLWARQRGVHIDAGLRPETDREVVKEAYDCAAAMVDWRAENDGVWRKPPQD